MKKHLASFRTQPLWNDRCGLSFVGLQYKSMIIEMFLLWWNQQSYRWVTLRNLKSTLQSFRGSLIYNGLTCHLWQLKQGSDNYNHAYAQTLVLLLKNKEVQASASSMQSEATQVNVYHNSICFFLSLLFGLRIRFTGCHDSFQFNVWQWWFCLMPKNYWV